MANWRLNIGDIINDGRRNLIITDREIRFMSNWNKPCNEKWVKYTCNNCGWTEGWSPEKALLQGKGCRCCKGGIVVNGINDIATKAPYIIPYCVNSDDIYKYTVSSNAIIKTKCPFCKTIRDYHIAQLVKAPYVCHTCGKNTSIPEKFFIEFLNIYHIDYIYQLSSAKQKWCKNFRYDFYLPLFNIIIELHGGQHYNPKGIYNRSYEEIHKNDDIKRQLAFENGIKNYYIIPTIRSEKNQLIASIINHEIIDVLKIDRKFLKENLEICYKKIFDKRSLAICQYYIQHPTFSAIKIAQHFNVSSTTVLHALWDGTELGFCHYDGQKKLQEIRKQNNLLISKKVEITKPNGEKIQFESIRELYRQSNEIFGHQLSRWYINKYCNTGENYNGFYLKYIN